MQCLLISEYFGWRERSWLRNFFRRNKTKSRHRWSLEVDGSSDTLEESLERIFPERPSGVPSSSWWVCSLTKIDCGTHSLKRFRLTPPSCWSPPLLRPPERKQLENLHKSETLEIRKGKLRTFDGLRQTIQIHFHQLLFPNKNARDYWDLSSWCHTCAEDTHVRWVYQRVNNFHCISSRISEW